MEDYEITPMEVLAPAIIISVIGVVIYIGADILVDRIRFARHRRRAEKFYTCPIPFDVDNTEAL